MGMGHDIGKNKPEALMAGVDNTGKCILLKRIIINNMWDCNR